MKPKGRRWSCEGADCGDDSEQRTVRATKKRLDKEDGESRGQHTASRSHGLTDWQAVPDEGERATATADSPQLMCGGALWHDWRSDVRGKKPFAFSKPSKDD